MVDADHNEVIPFEAIADKEAILAKSHGDVSVRLVDHRCCTREVRQPIQGR